MPEHRPAVLVTATASVVTADGGGTETLSTRRGPPGLRPGPQRAGALGAAACRSTALGA